MTPPLAPLVVSGGRPLSLTPLPLSNQTSDFLSLSLSLSDSSSGVTTATVAAG